MAADLGLIAHAAEGDANELAPRGLGDRFAQGGLADARRADEAHDRAFHLGRALLHGQILDDPLLDLLEAIVIVIQHLLRLAQVFLNAGFNAPRDRQHPIEVVPHHSGFGRHRAHVLELFDLCIRLFAGFLAQLSLSDTGFQLGHFVLAVFAIAQLVLNGLHLLIQIVFTLRALHLGFNTGLDLFLDLQDRHFALHQAVNLLKPLRNAERLQQVLLLLNFDAEVPGHEIGQTRRFGAFTNCGERFFGDVFLDLGVAFELIRHGAQQRLCGGRIARHLGQILSAGLKEIVVLKVFGDAHPRLPFDQHFDGAIGQFQQLQHIGQHARFKDTAGIGIILGGVDLARQQDLFVVRHHLFKSADRFFAANEKRHDHVGKHDDVAQRKHRVGCVQWL